MGNGETRHKSLGLPPNVVRLRNFTPLWRQIYYEEECLVREAIGRLLVDIQHVGSTSIPNIKAKPIIDILVGIVSLEHGLSLNEPLSKIGYCYLGDKVVPGHHVFGKGVNRSYLLHAVQYQSAAWTRIISFRDILTRDPNIAMSYEALKIRLSQQFCDDRVGYSEAKTPFIDDIIRKNANHGKKQP